MFLAVKMGGRVRTGISRTQTSSRDAQVFLAVKMGGRVRAGISRTQMSSLDV